MSRVAIASILALPVLAGCAAGWGSAGKPKPAAEEPALPEGTFAVLELKTSGMT